MQGNGSDAPLWRNGRDSLELSTDYVAPANAVERRLAEVFAKVFNLDTVGADDDFFELGGDSLSAVTLTAELQAEFGLEIKPSRLVELNTVSRLAGLIGDGRPERAATLPGNVASINETGRQAPLFIIHGTAGLTFLRPDFVAEFGAERPLHIFQAPGLDGAVEPLGTVGELAGHYLRSVLEVAPNGPVNLAAFCGGAWVAVEMVRLMKLEGLEPSSVTLIDPVMQKSLKDEYRHRRIARAAPPGTAQLAIALSDRALGLASRVNTLARTGRWIDMRSAGALDAPGMLERVVAAEMRREAGRAKRRRRRDRRSGAESAPTQLARERFLASYNNEQAMRTRVKLKHALRHCIPPVADCPVVIVGSSALRREMQDPDHPFNRLLPRHAFVVTGRGHVEAVSAPMTAVTIRETVEGAGA